MVAVSSSYPQALWAIGYHSSITTIININITIMEGYVRVISS
jgi:hypothetical protein